MLFNLNRFLARKYQEEAGQEGGKEGGSGDPSVTDLQAQIADLTKQNESIKAKSDELLTETKNAKRLKREAEELATKEATEKAKAANDFEQLYKSSEAQRMQAEEKYKDLSTSNANERKNGEALKLAAKLAEGDNVDLLQPFIAQRLKFSDDGLKVTDKNGELTVSSLADLENEFKNNAKFASLLKGNQSSGGGATGGSNSGGAAKSITKAEFEAMNPIAQKKYALTPGNTVT